MDNNSSPLETLRQLKEWLDAGTITPQEFETLKRKLLFSETSAPTPPTASPSAAPVAVPPLPPVAPPVTAPPPASPNTVAPPAAVTPAPVSTTFSDRSIVPPPTQTHVTAPPVEDPLLPPVVDAFGRPPLSAMVRDPQEFRTSEAPPRQPVLDQDDEFDGPAPEPERRQPLATVLIIGGALLLLALIAYLVLGNRKSERLTSSSMTPADTASVRIEEGPQAEQLDLPPTTAPETVRVQPIIPVQTPSATDTASANANPTTAPAADVATSEAALRTRVQRTLTALYSDLEQAPFSASQYFAPQVERFYSLQNTTPAAIDEELTRSHFPEFTESSISFDPATMQISPVTEDGSVAVTYNERGRSLRKSRNQYQQTVAQVRARFDRNGKITYFRQERLLENTFSDPKPAAPAPETTPEATPPQNQQ